MHYDPNIFDRPAEFLPERHMGPEPSYPRGAFRPFERGLRSCLGQTMAMEEMKVMLVAVARWYEFSLRDHGPSDKPLVGHTDLDTKLGIHAFQMQKFSAGARETVMMKISLAKQE